MRRPLVPVLLLLILSGCKPKMPPTGTVRLYLKSAPPNATAPQLHSSTSQVLLNLDYSGSKRFLEYETRVWAKGAPLPKPGRTRDILYSPRSTLRLTFKDGTPKNKSSFEFSHELRESKSWGGEISQGGSSTIEVPALPPGWVAALLPQESIEMPEGQAIAVWGLILHPQGIVMPAGSSLEQWAAKAESAILITLKVSD